ncbi:MAG: nucleotide binding protein, PINc [Candidatus Magnetoglobus multicellularis str. Araruama]|uniref:Nucleotide binding protein, PINc n=1 Tax=Candidatus Magnetoglobus multicellularis str. Araruama TaxID=890399 RepID=A0A1V1NV45_9BACT|nr:MAG: nucleotide binding protein, PINc [Candidatus Magnetoglobus multicellularis str. Araruama]
MNKFRFVIDTNVVFEGLTKKNSAPGILIDSWLAGLFDVYISNALAYEYSDVLSRKLSSRRWNTLKPVLGTLLSKCNFTKIYYSWRPNSQDPNDDHVIDCAMNSSATLITFNRKDFKNAINFLDLQVMSPVEALIMLANEG